MPSSEGRRGGVPFSPRVPTTSPESHIVPYPRFPDFPEKSGGDSKPVFPASREGRQHGCLPKIQYKVTVSSSFSIRNSVQGDYLPKIQYKVTVSSSFSIRNLVQGDYCRHPILSGHILTIASSSKFI